MRQEFANQDPLIDCFRQASGPFEELGIIPPQQGIVRLAFQCRFIHLFIAEGRQGGCPGICFFHPVLAVLQVAEVAGLRGEGRHGNPSERHFPNPFLIPTGRSQAPLAGLGFGFGRQWTSPTGDRRRELAFHLLGQDASEELVSGHGEMDMFVKELLARNPLGRLLGESLRGVHPGHRCAGLLDYPVDPGIGSDGEGIAIARPLEGCPRRTAVVQGELAGADAKL